MHHSSEPVLNQRRMNDSRSSSESIELIRTPTSQMKKNTTQNNHHSSSSSSRTSKESRQSSSHKLSEENIDRPSEPVFKRRNNSDNRSSTSTLESPRPLIPFKYEDTNQNNRHSSSSLSSTSKESRQSSSMKPLESKLHLLVEPVSNRRKTSDIRSSSSTIGSIRVPPIHPPYEGTTEHKRQSSKSSSSTSKASSSSSTISLGIKNNNRVPSSSSSSSFFVNKEDDQPAVNATSTKDQPNELSPRPPSRAETRPSSASDSQNEVNKDIIKTKYLSSSSSTTESDDDTLRSNKKPHSLDASDQNDHSNKNKHRSSTSSTSTSEIVKRNELVEKHFVNRKMSSSDKDESLSDSFSKQNQFKRTDGLLLTLLLLSAKYVFPFRTLINVIWSDSERTVNNSIVIFIKTTSCLLILVTIFRSQWYSSSNLVSYFDCIVKLLFFGSISDFL